MKKVLKKLILYVLPFLLIFGLFLAFEPYDYFGLRGGDSDYLCKPLSSVRELVLTHPENIVLGDSRMANLNMDLAEQFGISAIPCLVVFENGQEVRRSTGVIPKEQILNLIRG